MPQVFTCEHGHQWQAEADGPVPLAHRADQCPVCGEERVVVKVIPPTHVSPAERPTLVGPPAVSIDSNELPALTDYEFLAEIDRGGMGVVYKARHRPLKRLVAIKMILSGSHAGPQERTRFRIEAEAVARLQHPNIVQIYEVGEYQGSPYLALEYVDGVSLANRFAYRTLTCDQGAELLRDLARAAHFAHQRGVIHRDLKPANILLTTAGVPKIADFGLAKRLDSGTAQTKTGAILGTPSYMAPEQASGRSQEIGPGTDIYALGAMLYELLAGRPPFVADTPLDTAMLVVSEEPVPPSRLQPGVPRALETICLKCLEKEPRRRYGSADELADDLDRYLRGEPILARPPGPLGRLVRWANRQPGFAATLIAVVIFYLNHLLLLIVARLPGEGGAWHQFVTVLALVWVAGAGIFQRLGRKPGWQGRVVFGWATMEVLLLTALVARGAGLQSALLVGYLLLIAGAALRFRPGLIWYVTFLGMTNYGGLVAYTWVYKPDDLVALQIPIIFVLSLALMGLTQHLLLRRVRQAQHNACNHHPQG
jgi:eukaryotic-like serine/threonine-protein kinase